MFLEWKASQIPSSSLWVHGKRQFIPGPYAFTKTETFPFVAGAGKSVFWYVKLSEILSLGTYSVGQLHNHQGH